MLLAQREEQKAKSRTLGSAVRKNKAHVLAVHGACDNMVGPESSLNQGRYRTAATWGGLNSQKVEEMARPFAESKADEKGTTSSIALNVPWSTSALFDEMIPNRGKKAVVMRE